MKNTLLTFLITFLLTSCGEFSTVRPKSTKDSFLGRSIGIIVIDSCEYLIISNESRTLTHKGNCKYCLERFKKK